VDAAAAEILRQAASIFLEQLRQNQVFLLFLAVWRDRPKQMFSRSCAWRAIETKNNLFLSAARDAIAKHRHFLALACALFETKNNLKGEDLRYDCYYHY
jgi:hypothetical protein